MILYVLFKYLSENLAFQESTKKGKQGTLYSPLCPLLINFNMKLKGTMKR